MKKLFLILLLLSSSLFSHGQGTFLWDKFIKIPGNQELKRGIQSKSGRFWVAVSERDGQTVNGSSVIAFSDSTGDTLWRTTFFTEYPIKSQGWGVAHAPNGHFWVVVRYETNTIPDYNAGIAVFELDSLGQKLQHRQFMQGCWTYRTAGVYSLPNGGVLITGQRYWYSKTGACNVFDLFALCLDGEGNQVWQNTYEMEGEEVPRSWGLYPGNKVVLGYTTTYQEANMAFIDLQTGTMLYNKRNNMPGAMYPYTWPLRDGSFFVGGQDSANPNAGYLAHLDADFNVLWKRTVPHSSSFGRRFAETKDSCVVVAGVDSTEYNNFMAKIRMSDGQELWRKYFVYSILPAGPQRPIFMDLQVSKTGDVFVMGGASIGTPNPITLFEDYYIAKYRGVADFLQPSDYCTDSLQANFTGSWVGDTLRLYNASNSGMALQDSVDCQWLIGGSTVSIDTAINMQISPSAHPNGLPVTLVITNFWGCKDTLTATVTPQGIVGNKPVQKGVFVGEAYPNPASNSVSINYGLPSACKSAVVRMSEVGTGKVLIEQEISLTDNTLRLNTAPLAAGMYVLQVYADGAPLGVRKVSVVK